MALCKQPVSLLVQVNAIGLDIVRRQLLVTIWPVEHLVSMYDVDSMPSSGLNDVFAPYLVGMLFQVIERPVFLPSGHSQSRNPNIGSQDESLTWVC